MKGMSGLTAQVISHRARAGFSLLEVTLALSISGLVFGSLWQLTAVAGQQREAAYVASQMQTVGIAARDYINVNGPTLLALPQLATLNSTARIKVMASDTGHTADSLESAGFLPPGFVNSNSYNQTYVLYVRREDGGTAGAVDAADKLSGLLFTTGGKAITDALGSKIVSGLGASGGFIYSTDNPAPPAAATTVTGSNGGWSVALGSSGWSSIGVLAQAGRIATLVAMTPGEGSGHIPFNNTLDALDDVQTNYTAGRYNIFAGNSTPTTYGTGGYSTAFGYAALGAVVPNVAAANNTGLGYFAGNGFGAPPRGTDNTSVGYSTQDSVNAGSRNTAVGTFTLNNSQGNNDITVIGYAAGGSAFGATDLLAIGYAAARGSSMGVGINNLAIGAESGRYWMGRDNTLAGTRQGSVAPHTGDYNTALGFENIRNVTGAATYNTLIGYRAGYTLTTGGNNVIVGSSANTSSATASNEVNIGNLIFKTPTVGSNYNVSIGTRSTVAGISFELPGNTGAMRLAVGTNAQRPTCNASLRGAQRWNTSFGSYEVCDGSIWMQVAMDVSMPTPPAGSGYFVMTYNEWTGNLGGVAGANAKCLSDLTTYDWLGKSDASSGGRLTAAKVKAFICPNVGGYNVCNQASPNTTYYFARAGAPLVGGGSFTTDASGNGPNNAISWASANYFYSSAEFWSNRTVQSGETWANGDAAWASLGGSGCGNWTSSSSSEIGVYGNPTATNHNRWRSLAYNVQRSCDNALRLVCFVHP